MQTLNCFQVPWAVAFTKNRILFSSYSVWFLLLLLFRVWFSMRYVELHVLWFCVSI